MMLSRLQFMMRHELFQTRRKAYALIAIELQPFFGSTKGAYQIRHLASPNGRFPVLCQEFQK